MACATSHDTGGPVPTQYSGLVSDVSASSARTVLRSPSLISKIRMHRPAKST